MENRLGQHAIVIGGLSTALGCNSLAVGVVIYYTLKPGF